MEVHNRRPDYSGGPAVRSLKLTRVEAFERRRSGSWTRRIISVADLKNDEPAPLAFWEKRLFRIEV
jgi:hypothetical protein